MNYKITVNFGYTTLHETSRWEGNKLILGGFSRHYDQHGNLTHETAPTDNGSMDFGDMSKAEIVAITRGKYATSPTR